LSVLFGGWLWGIAGGLMAAPLLTVVKITCDQFESLRSVSTLLAGEAATPAAARADPAVQNPLKLREAPRAGAV
jgi:hypothetical protein